MKNNQLFLWITALAFLVLVLGVLAARPIGAVTNGFDANSNTPDDAVTKAKTKANTPEAIFAQNDTPSRAPAVASSPGETSERRKLKITVGDKTLTAVWAETTAAKELSDLLAESPLTIKTHDYGGFEKVGPLGRSLTTNDSQIRAAPGDIMLYQGNRIVFYYGTNLFSFTRLAKMEGVSGDELKNIFGSGDVTIVLSLEK
ncbi:MAG: hypothetical protein LBF38_01375 [Deltaproteobacteria bacterium]|jgi:hypothetical protein|nr:hypothetical protein [Deltaproteobacteria bacterium]